MSISTGVAGLGAGVGGGGGEEVIIYQGLWQDWNNTYTSESEEATRLLRTATGAGTGWAKWHGVTRDPDFGGKFYLEVEILAKDGSVALGVAQSGTNTVFGQGGTSNMGQGGRYQFLSDGRARLNNSSYTNGFGDAWNVGDRVGVGVDMDTGVATAYLNGVAQGTLYGSVDLWTLGVEVHGACYNVGEMVIRNPQYLPEGYKAW